MEVTVNNIDKQDYYKVKAISNSALSALNIEEGGNPTKFKRFIDNLEEKEETKSMELGTMIHAYIENQDDFAVADFDRPSDMMCQWVDYIYNYEKENPFTSKEEEDEFIIEIKNSLGIYSNIKDKVKLLEKFNKEGGAYRKFLGDSQGKIALTLDTKVKITNAIASIKAHPIAKELFDEATKNVFKEKKIFFELNYGGDKFTSAKSKPDWFSVDIENKHIKLIDIKTGSFTIGEYVHKFKNRHTYRQLYFYLVAIDAFIKQEFDIKVDDTWLVSCEVLAVSLKEDFKCVVFKIPGEWLDRGRDEFAYLLAIYAIHEEHGYEYFAEEYINNYKLELPFNE